MAKRLPKEDGGYVSTEIIKALGQSKSPAAKTALIELVKQPTLIDTKLAWIEASANLPDDQVKPVLNRWATSPDKRLADAANDALRGN